MINTVKSQVVVYLLLDIHITQKAPSQQWACVAVLLVLLIHG